MKLSKVLKEAINNRIWFLFFVNLYDDSKDKSSIITVTVPSKNQNTAKPEVERLVKSKFKNQTITKIRYREGPIGKHPTIEEHTAKHLHNDNAYIICPKHHTLLKIKDFAMRMKENKIIKNNWFIFEANVRFSSNRRSGIFIIAIQDRNKNDAINCLDEELRKEQDFTVTSIRYLKRLNRIDELNTLARKNIDKLNIFVKSHKARKLTRIL